MITQHFESLISDLKFNMRHSMEKEPEMNSAIILVSLDDASKINSGHEYIWPYDYYAETIKKITDGNPTSFGMDIIFTNTVDSVGWSNLISQLSESYMAINPYIAKIGDKKNPLDVNQHGSILKEIKLDKLPSADSFNINHIIDIFFALSKSL